MGKIQKIKADRKRLEVEAQMKKMRRNRFLAKWGSLAFAIAIFGILAYSGGSLYLKNHPVNLSFLKKENKKVASTYDSKTKTYKAAPAMQIDVKKTYLAKVETSDGNFTIRLNAADVPKTVNNFVTLSKDGFYNDTVFHRIIKDFMIQGGDPKGNGTGGPGYKFADEKFSGDYTQGTVAMANSGANTNGSQFFIMTGDYSNGKLPKNYTVFGKVESGMDVIAKIAATPVSDNGQGEKSKPDQKVTIKKISIEEK